MTLKLIIKSNEISYLLFFNVVKIFDDNSLFTRYKFEKNNVN